MALSFKTSCILIIVNIICCYQLINCEDEGTSTVSVVSASEVVNRIPLQQAVDTCNSTYKIDEGKLYIFITWTLLSMNWEKVCVKNVKNLLINYNRISNLWYHFLYLRDWNTLNSWNEYDKKF